ncbi:MAG: hypothetical protein M0R77_03080 [Gammaproteobacteria bacterium]|nr:hypothetical protein [Gammaproteobacteria bacterium]
MSVIELIQTIRNVNVIEDTIVDYSQTDRNQKLADSLGRVDVTELTSEEALNLGFGIWDEETNLHLIPYYLYDFLEYGQELESISGDTRIVTPEYKDNSSSNYIDSDYRFGCLAYGFRPKE